MSATTGQRRRQITAALVSAALGAGVLTACGGSPGGASQEPVEIRMWTFLDPAAESGRGKVLGQLIDQYESAHPGVTVNVEVQQWDTMSQQFLAADVAGSAPDVQWLALDQVANAAEQGALADLNEVAFGKLPADQREALRDVYWKTMETDGKIYGVVHSRNYMGLMYRADLLKAKGIDPATIKTWDDLIAAGKALTDPAANRWGLGQAFATSFADPQVLSARMMENQGTLFADDGAPEWTTPAAVEAMEFQASLIKDAKITPEDSVRLTAEDLYELFSAGQVAMINAASARVPVMQQQVGAENVGFMHYPSKDGAKPAPGTLLGWSVGVWNGSKVKDAAGEFVAYLTTPEADQQWLLDAQQPPLYAATAEANADFLGKPENSFLKVVLEGSQQYGWLPPTQFSTAGWRESLNDATQQVLLGNAVPAQALEKAAQSMKTNG